MQNFTDISGTATLSDSREPLLNNDKSVASNFSGISFPSTNLQVGMRSHRTDENKVYALRSISPSVWTLVEDLNKTLVNLEDAEANYLRKDDNLLSLTNKASARANLELGSASTENVVPLTKGGTGATTAAAARTALGLGTVAVENTVPLAKGGTGAVNAAAARINLAVPSLTTTITGASGLTGGGDLSANRTISPDYASQAEAEAGVATTKSMNPLRVKQAILALAPQPEGKTLIGIDVITATNSTYAFPAGTTEAIIWQWGGGGNAGANGGDGSLGGPGARGSFAIARRTGAFSGTHNVTVAAGSATSFGTWLTVAKGGNGTNATQGPAPDFVWSNGGAGTPGAAPTIGAITDGVVLLGLDGNASLHGKLANPGVQPGGPGASASASGGAGLVIVYSYK